jgi:DnaJ-class molecular chaperone
MSQSATSSSTSSSSGTNDYYQILGIERTATTEQISKAFRKTSLQHHPDRGGDPKTYQIINEASDVLSNPQTRIMYDKYGPNWKELSKKTKRKISDDDIIEQIVSVMPLKLMNDYPYETTIQRRTLCQECAGDGYKTLKMKPCTNCNGKGVALKKVNIPMLGLATMQEACDTCHTTGKVPDLNNSGPVCISCNGSKFTLEDYSLTFTIYAGTPNNYVYPLVEVGHEVAPCQRAPIVLKVKYLEDENKDGYKIHPNGNISLTLAVRFDQLIGLTPIIIPSIGPGYAPLEFTAEELVIPPDSKWKILDRGFEVRHNFNQRHGNDSLPEEIPAKKGHLCLTFQLDMPLAMKMKEIKDEFASSKLDNSGDMFDLFYGKRELPDLVEQIPFTSLQRIDNSNDQRNPQSVATMFINTILGQQGARVVHNGPRANE